MSVAQAYAILEYSSVVELPGYIRRVPGSIPGVPIFQNGGMAMIREFVEYVKQTWKNKPNVSSPLNADRLNHMEDGIENNSKKIKETVTAVNELTEKTTMTQLNVNTAPVLTTKEWIQADGGFSWSVPTAGWYYLKAGFTKTKDGSDYTGDMQLHIKSEKKAPLHMALFPN